MQGRQRQCFEEADPSVTIHHGTGDLPVAEGLLGAIKSFRREPKRAKTVTESTHLSPALRRPRLRRLCPAGGRVPKFSGHDSLPTPAGYGTLPSRQKWYRTGGNLFSTDVAAEWEAESSSDPSVLCPCPSRRHACPAGLAVLTLHPGLVGKVSAV